MMMDHPRIALLGVAFAVALSPFVTARLTAQEHHHPAEDAGIHNKFYSTWMRPDHPNLSCCSNIDCAPAEARMVNGEWVARKRGETVWYRVPEVKVEKNRDSPDGRNHLCAMGTNVYCFIAGSGS